MNSTPCKTVKDKFKFYTFFQDFVNRYNFDVFSTIRRFKIVLPHQKVNAIISLIKRDNHIYPNIKIGDQVWMGKP